MLFVALSLGGGAACENEVTPVEVCAPGTVGCACTPTSTCAGTLVCQDGTCARATVPAPFESRLMDRRVNPCEDFYRFSCGGWIDRHPTNEEQPDRNRFAEALESRDPTLVEMLHQAYKQRDSAEDPETVVIGKYIDSCLQGAKHLPARDALKALMAPINQIASLDDLARASAELRKLGVETMFLQYSNVDYFEPTRQVLTIDQGARTLAPAYYLDPGRSQQRAAYETFITRNAGLLGVTIDAPAVLRVETALAKAETVRPAKPDPRTVEHNVSFAGLTQLAPSFPWQTTFRAYGLGAVAEVNVRSPEFVKKLEALLPTIPLADWKHYLAWQLLFDKIKILDQPFIDEWSAFSGETLPGKTADDQRVSLCLNATLGAFDKVMTRKFVEKQITPAHRSMAVEMTMSIRASFARRLMSLSWLDEETRRNAQAKLDDVVALVPTPEKLPRITAVRPVKSFFDEQLDASRANTAGIIKALGEPVDRANTWITSGLEVNAFYAAAYNSITLPAGILMRPFFDPGRSPLGNYAMLGSIVGHEFTHGFDNRGRFYDGKGAIKAWWTMATNAEFEARSMCVKDFYDQIEALPGQRVNGQLTLGENIADLGGVRLAYDAAMQVAGSGPIIEGFDPRQQFFLAYGQTWCGNQNDESIARQLKDTHAPNPARVFGTLANTTEFAEAWNCPVTARMRAQNACSVW